MTTVNKLKNAWLSNDTTNLDGTYGKVSLLNEGKTELKSDTIVNKLAINKNIDSVTDYKLDVNGNINFSGDIYKNGALFTSGITLAQVQSNQNNFTNNFTVDNKSTTGSNITFNSRAITLTTPNTNDFSNGLRIQDESGRVYFSTFPQDLNTAIINPNSVTGYMYINQNTVFQGGITLQTNGGVGGVLQVGTGYGVGKIYVNNGTIEVDSSSASNKLKVNVIDTYNPSTVSSIYPAITNTLNIGNSANTYNVNMYGIWNVLGSIKSNNLTITPAQLSFLNQVDGNNTIPTSSINGINNYANINGLNKLTGSYASTSITNLNFGDNQYLILTGSPGSMTINLPNPATSNIGARFSIINRVGAFAGRNVYAPTGQTIWDYNSNISANSFNIDNIGVLELLCLGPVSTTTNTWAIINRDDTVLKFGNTSISGIKTFNSPPVMSGASITSNTIPTSSINGISNYLLIATASTTYVPNSGDSAINGIKTFNSPPVMSGASIQSNTIPTSAINGISNYLLSATASTTYVPNSGNSTIDGIKTFNSPPVMSGASITSNSIPSTAISYTTYIPNSVSTLTPSTNITLTSPLYNYYTFTSASTASTITLPIITNAILGCPLTFRRVGNTTSALIIKTPASSNTTIVQRASIAETAQNTNYTFLSTTQFIGTVMAISLTKWSVVA